jgi:hypothetical protein
VVERRVRRERREKEFLAFHGIQQKEQGADHASDGRWHR